MFHVGDVVIKPSIGVCRITAIRRLDIQDRTEDYYVIQATNAEILVPKKLADHGAIRMPMNEEMLNEVLAGLEAPFRPVQVVPNGDLPEIYQLQFSDCKDILKRRQPLELVELVRTLYNKQNDFELDKKESQIFTDASNFLVEEIAYLEKTTKGRVKSQINKLLSLGRKEGRRQLAAEEA